MFAADARASAGFDGAVAAIRSRLTAECGAERYARLSPGEVMARLSPGELDALGTGFVRFELSAPAWVHVVIPAVKKGDPFWLESRGFKRDETGGWMIGGGGYETWSRRFEAGRVGLGVPSLSAEPDVYSVVITADGPGRPVPRVSHPAPEKLVLAKVAENGPIHADSGRRAEKVPSRFLGATLIRGLNARKQAGRLFRVYRLTEHPASPFPDQVMLTWTGEPATTQTIRWRTAASVTRGCAAFAPAAAAFDPAAAARVESGITVLSTPDVANDPVVHLHTVELRGLKPGGTCAYAVGDGSPGGWTQPKTFRREGKPHPHRQGRRRAAAPRVCHAQTHRRGRGDRRVAASGPHRGGRHRRPRPENPPPRLRHRPPHPHRPEICELNAPLRGGPKPRPFHEVSPRPRPAIRPCPAGASQKAAG
ncbi:MAG: fibronectin type III domain-containing protein [Opitutaceae bacterium]|jgi:hypothetical protein|nr:fibronectin type III domain-containing protein [Opitutaceae bacterium]